MKKILIFLWLSIFIHCQTQNINKIIPIIDDKFEKFDIEKFKKESIRGSYVVKVENFTIRQDSQNPGYLEELYKDDDYFILDKFFYENGNIKKKGISFNKGSSIGIWYHYNEEGNLTKQEDTDFGYLFKPEDIVEYCKKNNIELSKGYHERNGYQTRIYKNEVDGKKVWLISYINSLNKQDKEIKLILDGQTGKEIKREEFPYDNY
ncbi:hypothetical protein VUJ46_13800 [Chryseobacterium sp. MYb264]|uniref:hypothetical protein n=1 Tax=Chryseobacterium sp. MYb264 TaxID=2745153 RepID=UPI002E0D8633|nr:hypothetical protein VUJ46_13800 [Chryseobacterium sp. MYb264]